MLRRILLKGKTTAVARPPSVNHTRLRPSNQPAAPYQKHDVPITAAKTV